MFSQSLISVLIADDQMVLRMGLKATLELIPGVTIVGEASDGQAAIASAERLCPALVFMDVAMPNLDGIEATRVIKENHPETRVIIFTSSEDDNVFFRALSAGADGYCLKDATQDQLTSAITAVMQGAKWLDAGVASKLLHLRKVSSFGPEQREVLQMIEAGLGISEIAKAMNKPLTDVKVQLRDIATRLQSPQALDKSSDSALQELKDLLESANHSQSKSSQNRTGQTLDGKYILEEIIGVGGMSVIYRARHKILGKLVAVKMLHSHLVNNDNTRQRLHFEACSASSISHPNIVAVHDFGMTADDQPYLVMDYVIGDTLRKVLDDRGKLTTEFCLPLCIDVCDALIALQLQNIVHRDLKPDNIMMVDEKGKPVTKILDFGIAKMLAETGSSHQTTLEGVVFGSPPYISPEQCLGKPVDHRADLYSLGCVMYEMLTGVQAYAGKDTYNIIWRHVNETPSRLPFLSKDNQVPIRLVSAIFKLTSIQSDRRFQSAQELKDELSAIYDSLANQDPHQIDSSYKFGAELCHH